MGDSSQTQTTQSQTTPWAEAMPTVKGLFGQLNGLIPNTGATSAQTDAINQLTQMGQAGNPYASAIGNTATSLLGGGGAQTYAPMVQNAYNTYQTQTGPVASNTNYDPMSTPGLGDQLQALRDSITGGVNGQFAAGGRDFSGANSKALAGGLAAGLAPVITAQYNANRDAQQAAAGNLFNAGNTAAGTLSGFNNQANANKVQGVQTAGDALNAQNWGPQQVITAQQLGQSIPASNLGLLAQIGIPLAGLGTNQNGTSTVTKSPSILDDISSATGAVKNLGGLGAIGSSAAGGLAGLSGLLAMI